MNVPPLTALQALSSDITSPSHAQVTCEVSGLPQMASLYLLPPCLSHNCTHPDCAHHSNIKTSHVSCPILLSYPLLHPHLSPDCKTCLLCTCYCLNTTPHHPSPSLHP